MTSHIKWRHQYSATVYLTIKVGEGRVPKFKALPSQHYIYYTPTILLHFTATYYFPTLNLLHCTQLTAPTSLLLPCTTSTTLHQPHNTTITSLHSSGLHTALHCISEESNGWEQNALIHSLHVSKPSQYSLIHSTRQVPSYSGSSTHLFIPNSTNSWYSHQTSWTLHVRTFTFLLSALLMPHASNNRVPSNVWNPR